MRRHVISEQDKEYLTTCKYETVILSGNGFDGVHKVMYMLYCPGVTNVGYKVKCGDTEITTTDFNLAVEEYNEL